jgi:predicted PurR-regulated permease PerM
MFFIGIYKKLFGRIKRKKFIKPLAICSTYLALIIFCGVLIAFIIPQLTNSVKLFASNAGIYMSGFENYVNNTAQLLHVKNLDLSGFDNVFDSFVASIYDIVIGVIPNLMNITSGVVSVLFTIVLAFVISIYLLSEKETLIRQMKNLTYACVRQVESA